MSTPSVYALLVGVDRYDNPQQAPHLRGCVADTQAMYDFLTTRLEIPDDRILWLTSKMDQSEPPEMRATRDNILRGWQQHLAQAGEGDHVFFHYSGHGAQAKTIDPVNEPDGLDETIVPADSRTPGVFDILDKELAALIAGIEANGARVTCFMDCCHSGSGTRQVADEVGENAPRTRMAAGDDRDRPMNTVVTAPSGTRSVSGPKGPSGILPVSEHILLAGCRDEELSHEYRAPETGQWHGATTYFLLKKLAGYQPGMTWGEVHDYVQSNVHVVYPRQSPQLEGPGEIQVFGGVGERVAPYVKVTEIDQQDPTSIKLGAGAAVGLSVGSRVAIYPVGGDMKGAPLVRATLEEVRVDHSWAKLDSPVSVALGSRGLITSLGEDAKVFTVATDDTALILAMSTINEGQPSPLLRQVAQESMDADVWVKIVHGHYAIQDGTGTQLVHQTAPVGVEGATVVVDNLEHLAKFSHARTLHNPASFGELAGQVKLDVVTGTYTRRGLQDTRSIRNAGNESVITAGTPIQISLTNNHHETLYMAILYLRSDFGIEQYWPKRGANEPVPPGTTVPLAPIGLGLSDKQLTKGVEIFKVIATKQPTDFSSLRLPPLNVAEDGKTREIMALGGDSTDDDWTVAQVEITVLAATQDVALPADVEEVDAGTTLDITVKKPKGFLGRLLASTLGNASRSAGDITGGIPQPPGMTGLNADRYFAPVGMGAGGTRSADASPVVLGFDAAPDQLQSITPDSPMTLEVNVENDPDIAGLLPIAYDGEFYYIAGEPAEATGTRSVAANKRSMAVTVDFLPVPEARDDDGEVGTRDLKRTVNLFLYKIMHNDLPPGLGVRKADLDAAGQPAYSPVSADDVRNARRVVLMVHGFTSETEWLVYHAWPFAKQRGYDLCLTYDYETFNTGIKENGRKLADQLNALGFGPNDGVKLDIFCHSMGTQVTRAMVELFGGEDYVDRVFMGGALNAGSALAKAHKLLPWVSTVMLNGGAVAVPPVMMASWALKKITDMAVGVRDMDPDSAFFAELNRRTKPVTVPYFVQIGTNQPMSAQSVNWTRLFSKAGLMKGADMGLDAILGENDIAVGVASARAVESAKYPNAKVVTTTGNHFHYFTDRESKTILEGWV